jgi:hypothetical protein
MYASLIIIRVIKSRRMRWAKTIIPMKEKEEENFENLGADGGVWTGLIWLRMWTDGGFLRIRP